MLDQAQNDISSLNIAVVMSDLNCQMKTVGQHGKESLDVCHEHTSALKKKIIPPRTMNYWCDGNSRKAQFCDRHEKTLCKNFRTSGIWGFVANSGIMESLRILMQDIRTQRSIKGGEESEVCEHV